MKKIFTIIIFALLSTTLNAHEFTLGKLVIHHPYARATVPSAKNGAAFTTIDNTGEMPDKLISASASVAKSVELHTHLMVNGVAKMREVLAIEIPAHGKAELKPGSFHVMLIDLVSPLKEGESFMLKLKFAHAGEIEVKVNVEGLGATH